MGSTDKIVRIILAIVFAILYFQDIVPSPWSYALLVFAGIFVLTSLVSFCPLYPIFGISTCKKKN
ncbi:MAG: DUF2892 domain-containing protein [Flavobacteriales bacterium]